MVVGPEFGPLAALCVAIVRRRAAIARRSATALLVGFPLAIVAAYLLTAACARVRSRARRRRRSRIAPQTFFISHPDAFSVIVALLAGTAGMLSLSTAKAGALIGVLISVTTIPAAANIGVAAAYRNWDECQGAALQLVLNLSAIVLAGRRDARCGTHRVQAPARSRLNERQGTVKIAVCGVGRPSRLAVWAFSGRRTEACETSSFHSS